MHRSHNLHCKTQLHQKKKPAFFRQNKNRIKRRIIVLYHLTINFHLNKREEQHSELHQDRTVNRNRATSESEPTTSATTNRQANIPKHAPKTKQPLDRKSPDVRSYVGLTFAGRALGRARNAAPGERGRRGRLTSAEIQRGAAGGGGGRPEGGRLLSRRSASAYRLSGRDGAANLHLRPSETGARISWSMRCGTRACFVGVCSCFV